MWRIWILEWKQGYKPPVSWQDVDVNHSTMIKHLSVLMGISWFHRFLYKVFNRNRKVNFQKNDYLVTFLALYFDLSNCYPYIS
ncbi:unnamed protein product [Photorhabdus laumondii subsp. laumondii TTO1]|uniref:Photorhabdus luminescens subsp. laumondii TTO1 complete genome segment 7/17 n=1 Tax=Photorhabdus laumondii subsp. laumondii (strain DSM 15139 / CIP 105565 / TT01) TaxID=243265 RepID=Q7N5G7_PHOLL|nr:unnamed protein product [Photorhabdus laumondii subsp. laumondii TTO1]